MIRINISNQEFFQICFLVNLPFSSEQWSTLIKLHWIKSINQEFFQQRFLVNLSFSSEQWSGRITVWLSFFRIKLWIKRKPVNVNFDCWHCGDTLTLSFLFPFSNQVCACLIRTVVFITASHTHWISLCSHLIGTVAWMWVVCVIGLYFSFRIALLFHCLSA